MRHCGNALAIVRRFVVAVSLFGSVANAQQATAPRLGASEWARRDDVPKAVVDEGFRPPLVVNLLRGQSVAASAASAPGKPQAQWFTPLVSLLVPGGGQGLLGQQRGVAYAAAEVYLVAQAVTAQRDGARDRREYRRIAAEVARNAFGGSRPTGPWEYYELLEKYDVSGVYDRIPGGDLDPETDESTYNGRSWRDARETFWVDPDVPPPRTSAEYQRALTFYRDRAVRDEYRWSWRDALNQKDLYVQAVAASNRNYKRALNFGTVVGANHLASMIDAYITVRVRRYGGAGVAGLRVDGVETRVSTVGDPREGKLGVVSVLRLSMPH